MDLLDWFKVIHLMLTAKKGVSARQVHRYMGFGSLKTAWYMCHRIRAAMIDTEFQQLVGVVEVDETFVGGKAKNKHKDKGRGGPGRGGMGSGKTPVVGAVSRKGNVVARVVENVKGETLTNFVREAVSTRLACWSLTSGLATTRSARNTRRRSSPIPKVSTSRVRSTLRRLKASGRS